MNNKITLLSLLIITILAGCSTGKAIDQQKIETIDYQEPSKIILEITEKTGNQDQIDAAELNLDISKQKSLVKKAETLVKISKIKKKKSINK